MQPNHENGDDERGWNTLNCRAMNSLRPDAVPVFATTHWTVVLKAGRHQSPEASRALAELCRAYWYPLYAYARRVGHDVHSAEDLTQGFFERLLEKNYLELADPQRGKFRWFLLTAFKCFLANEFDRSRALKRGGSHPHVFLDALEAEQRYALEPTDTVSADQLYDRRWALELIARVQKRLRDEYTVAKKADRFDRIEKYLPGGEAPPNYGETATALGLSEDAVRQEVHRLRKRYGELLRGEIAATVAHPEEVDEEVNYLIDVICRC
jgi:RNA polymerase sigma-70 factor (ECF subfamily)